MKKERVYYRGQANYQWGLSPSINRGSRYSYSYISNEDIYFQESAKTVIGDQVDIKKTSNKLSFLGKMQHYGFKTRLLDISRNYDVALYFAYELGKDESKDNDGYYIFKDRNTIDASLYLFKDKKSYIKGENTKSILRKLYCSIYPERDKIVGKKDWIETFMNIENIESLSQVNNVLDNITKPSIVDYNQLDMSIPENGNVRVMRQQGSFIIFGNVVEEKYFELKSRVSDKLKKAIIYPELQTEELNNNSISDFLEYEKKIIKGEDKINYLVSLVSKGIYSMYLFPDYNSSILLEEVLITLRDNLGRLIKSQVWDDTILKFYVEDICQYLPNNPDNFRNILEWMKNTDEIEKIVNFYGFMMSDVKRYMAISEIDTQSKYIIEFVKKYCDIELHD